MEVELEGRKRDWYDFCYGQVQSCIRRAQLVVEFIFLLTCHLDGSCMGNVDMKRLNLFHRVQRSQGRR